MLLYIMMLWHTVKLSCIDITQGIPGQLSKEPFQFT